MWVTVEPPCCIFETNMTLYINNTLIKKATEKKIGGEHTENHDHDYLLLWFFFFLQDEGSRMMF